MSWKIIARHKWVAGATITESYNTNDDRLRRFTATIRGYRNWKLGEYQITLQPGQWQADLQDVITKAKLIRDRIDAGDESVFYERG